MANPYSAARSSAGEWHPCFGSAPGRRGQAWAGRGSWADVEVHERLTQVPAVEMHGRPPRPTCQRLLQLHRTVLEVHRTIGRRRPICMQKSTTKQSGRPSSARHSLQGSGASTPPCLNVCPGGPSWPGRILMAALFFTSLAYLYGPAPPSGLSGPVAPTNLFSTTDKHQTFGFIRS